MIHGLTTKRIQITTSPRSASRRLVGWQTAARRLSGALRCRLETALGQREEYFARFQQQVNRIVDVGPTIEKENRRSLDESRAGAAGEAGARLRESLASRGLGYRSSAMTTQPPIVNTIKTFLLKENADLGAKHGLQYAEQFRYIQPPQDPVDEYVKQHAVSL